MNDTDRKSAERNYKAFISYRHKPLDSEFAGKLHKRIERYVVPADLRRNGEKKLGLVFRDLEELPIADDLAENIRIALDHSEYLIVMCSPDTPGSVWVQKEISYFLEHHTRNHILACLVSGTPEEAFPPQLTEIRDENGVLLDRVEPLAANIVADSAGKRNLLFRTESLRILASLIGCPYDALYRREQRYRTRRLLASFAAVLAIATAFICMLLDRNAKIREQLLETKRNESEILAYVSQIDLQEGDYRKALENALDALPGRDPDRPYVASAESALSDALYLYRRGMTMRYIQSFEQDTEIRTVRISPDKKLLATGDAYGIINLYDISTGNLLWSMQHTDEPKHLDFIGSERLLVRISGYDHVCLSTADGAVIWKNDEAVIEEVSPEAGICLCTAYEKGGSYPVWFIDAYTGEKIVDLGKLDKKYSMLKAAAISPDGSFAAVLLPYANEKLADIWVYDLHSGEGKRIDEGLYYTLASTDYTLLFGKNGDLAVAACGDQDYLRDQEGWDTAFLELFDSGQDWNRRYKVSLDFGTVLRGKNGLIDTSDYMDYMEFGDAGIAMASKTRLFMVDAESGQIRWSRDLPDYVINGHMFQTDDMCLALANGLITWCSSSDGMLSYDFSIGYFMCDYPLSGADSEGDLFIDEISAVISQKSRGRVSCISFCGTDGTEPFPGADKIPEKARLYYSPSGKTMASVLCDYDNHCAKICRLDPSGNEAAVEMSKEEKGALSSAQDHIFVTEEGRLIMGGKVYDLADGTETLLTPGLGVLDSIFDLTDASCKRMRDHKIITASVDRKEDGTYCLLLWEDGELTGETPLPLQSDKDGHNEKFSYCGCAAVGAGGTVVVYAQEEYEGPRQYAVYLTGEDRWIKASFPDSDKEAVLALAEEHPWMAVQCPNNTLKIFDVSDGEDDFSEGSGFLAVESGIPGESVTKMMFAGEDQYLIVLTRAGELAVFSTEDGQMIHRSSYGASYVRFDADARYDVHILPEQRRMLVICDDLSFIEPFSISIDLDSFEKNGFYHTISGCLPMLGKVVSNAYLEEICYYPLYTTEEIEMLAEDYLANGNPG